MWTHHWLSRPKPPHHIPRMLLYISVGQRTKHKLSHQNCQKYWVHFLFNSSAFTLSVCPLSFNHFACSWTTVPLKSSQWTLIWWLFQAVSWSGYKQEFLFTFKEEIVTVLRQSMVLEYSHPKGIFVCPTQLRLQVLYPWHMLRPLHNPVTEQTYYVLICKKKTSHKKY